jgi:glycerol uptake facilitator-like aquaporin
VGFKGLIAATAAVALMTAPTVAAAQSAAQVAPATETVDSGSELRGGFIIPLLAIVAVVLGVLAATNDDDDDLPTTP